MPLIYRGMEAAEESESAFLEEPCVAALEELEDALLLLDFDEDISASSDSVVSSTGLDAEEKPPAPVCCFSGVTSIFEETLIWGI